MPRPSPSTAALPAGPLDPRAQRPGRRFGPGSAWGTWGLGTAALLLLCAWTLGLSPDVDSVRLQIRATARSSLCFFLLAYVASSWRVLHPGCFSDWLRQRRRQWGLLFATSHALHAAGLVALHHMASPALWAQLTSLPSWILGDSGYLVLTLMALSSHDAAVRALGRARWSRLHRLGLHGLWTLFLLSCAKRVGGDPFYLLPVSLLLGALAARLWAHLLKRRGSSL